ncbi:hypothetical protein Ciccas_009952 [Cichlidogyrus casuarinus]|uniref:Uncharacterized protein n=1 Tax=Cichlidogyrus casuarinus TaxID=1844966 RepID=A0ABD2PWA1_9PLAT
MTRDQEGNTLLHVVALLGHAECARILVKRGLPLNMPNKAGYVSLHHASEKGHFHMVQSLLNLDADQGFTALHLAVQNVWPRVVELLIGYGADVNLKSGKMELAPIHIAATQHEISISVLSHDGNLPLHIAVRHCHLSIVKTLIDHVLKTDSQEELRRLVNHPNNEGETPFHFASELEQSQVHAPFEDTDMQGYTALHLSAEKNHRNVCSLLLKNRAFVNAKSKRGFTPLHLAAQAGNKELFIELIKKHNAQVDILTNSKKNSLHLAAMNGNKGICEFLLGISGESCLLDAALTDAVSASCCYHLMTKNGDTPLHLAALHDHADLVRLFCKVQPELINKANLAGMTAAHTAALRGSNSALKELIRFNRFIVVSTTNKLSGSLALHLAAENGHQEIVKLLLDAGSEPSLEDQV